jgi:hypothetical protein
MSHMTYQKRLEKHLTDYKVQRLGIRANGTFTYRGKTRAYGHILPRELKWLNVPEPYRREIREYVTKSNIRLHKFFHHLNSSQAYALAAFYPYLNGARHVLENALAVKPIERWKFEHVPDSVEGTNVDVWWRSANKTESYCEVKLSEGEFGPATNDARHLKKLEKIYRPILESHVDNRLLEPRAFFKNYQILRNLWLAARKGHEKDSVVFVLPRANTNPNEQLTNVLSQVRNSLRTRVQIVHVEVLLERLAAKPAAGDMSWYAAVLAEKYLPR